MFELTYRFSLLQQTILSVFHLEVRTASSATDPVVEAADIVEGLKAGAATGFHQRFMEAMPSNAFLNEIRAQAITPSRWALFAGEPGAWTGARSPTAVSNIAAVITKRTLRAGRRERGSTHLPTGGSLDVANGTITTTLTTALNNFGATMVQNVNGLSFGGSYAHVIFHRGPQGGIPSPITSGVAQNTVRTMHRRTVGLGI